MLDVSLVPRPPDCPVPLSATQRWYLRHLKQCLGPGGRGNRSTHIALRLNGPLQVAWLCEGIDVLVRRHESLRTRIVSDGDVMRQVIDAPTHRDLDIVDVSGSSAGDSAARLDCLIRAFLCEPVDLAAGPLFAARLFRCSSLQHVLVLGLDHSITDLTSNLILFQELSALYDQAARGLRLALPDLRVQYADYAIWQHRTQDLWMERHAPYWNQLLCGAPRTRLPIHESRAVEGAYDIRSCPVVEIPLGTVASGRLRQLSRQHRTPLSVATLTVYVAAMACWCRQRDLVINLVHNARHGRDLLGMVGFLASTLYLRLCVAEHDSFATLLERAKAALSGAYQHHDLHRVTEMFPECETELAFNWAPAPNGKFLISAGDLTIEPFVVSMPWSRRYFALFRDTPAGIVADVWYRPNPVGPDVIEQFGSTLRRFAHAWSQEPRTPQGAIAGHSQ